MSKEAPSNIADVVACLEELHTARSEMDQLAPAYEKYLTCAKREQALHDRLKNLLDNSPLYRSGPREIARHLVDLYALAVYRQKQQQPSPPAL